MAASDDFETEHIGRFAIRFRYPVWWQKRVEHDDGRETYVFWDVETGTLRMTPWRHDAASFDIDAFLQNRHDERDDAEWRAYNNRRTLCYEEDGSDDTRLHWYISGHENTILACSFCYLRELLDDEDAAEAVADSLKEVDAILDSLTIG